jgi:hypothetical protein
MNKFSSAARALIAFVVSLAVICSLFSFGTVTALADSDLKISVTYFVNGSHADSLSSGSLKVGVVIPATFEDDIIVSCGYYDSDGTLLSFSPSVVSPASLTVSKYVIRYIDMEIPSTVSNEQYVKTIAMFKSSLEPITVSDNTISCNSEYVLGVDTVYDALSERYYTLDSALGSISANKKVISVSDTATPLRIKDMGDGEYAFEDTTQPRYRLRCEGDAVDLYYYLSSYAAQRWKIEKYASGYSIESSLGGYLAIEDSNVVISSEKYEWQLNLVGETPFSLMTSLDGFKLLSSAEQQRVIDICTSVGADLFPAAVTSGSSWLDSREKEFSSLYYSRKSLTAEEQRDKILEIVSTPFFSLVEYYKIADEFPGAAEETVQSDPVKTKHVVWDIVEENGVYYSADDDHPYVGDEINCYLIKVTYKTGSQTQTVNLYCIDPEFENVQNTITALGKFPYNYRKFIKNVYVYKSTTTSTYNCGSEELFVRLMGEATATDIEKGIAHELGHSVDYNANGNPNTNSTHWCQGSAWQSYVADDIATISTYGNSNYYEGFAEFSRLYFFCYGDRDMQIGIEQLYPNRFASFERLLTKIGGIDMY